tara:strand:- start:175 stop:390 length:216 start_codon:yes stop_codon:yes gene_type:complete
MIKFVLVFIICSSQLNVCSPPLEWNGQFNDSYDCMVKGYNESLKKMLEFGKDKVNKQGIYIKFSCQELETI